jgi:broad specificity phosphatase PhoE
MITTIDIIRHGEVLQPTNRDEWTLYGPDRPLSELGKQKIRILGQFLHEQGVQYDYVYTSPFVRTTQTVEELLFEDDSALVINDHRLEDVHSPGWIGQPWSLVQTIGFNAYRIPKRHPEQESIAQVQLRMRNALFEFAHEHIDQHIAIVSHGDTIAFGVHALEYPHRYPAPDENGDEAGNYYDTVKQSGYPERGSVWRLTFENGTFRERTVIFQASDTEGRFTGSKERK